MGIKILDQVHDQAHDQVHELGGSPSAAERVVTRSLENRRAAYEDEIQRLVDAALVLIRDQGNMEPRVSEIVGKAGLSNKAFYRHFRSKHELLVAVLDDGIERLGHYLAHRMTRARSPLGAIREWIRGMLEQALHPEGAESTRPFVLAKGRLADAFPEEVAASERRLTETLRQAIETARDVGELPDAHPAADAEAIYHLTMGWIQARLAEPDETARELAARLEAFALAGLLQAGAWIRDPESAPAMVAGAASKSAASPDERPGRGDPNSGPGDSNSGLGDPNSGSGDPNSGSGDSS